MVVDVPALMEPIDNNFPSEILPKSLKDKIVSLVSVESVLILLIHKI